MESCLYEGAVHHERLTPVRHRFGYRLYLAYIDLAEAPALRRAGLLSQNRFGLASFRRSDHAGVASEPLETAVRSLVQRHGARADGPIRLLTPLSCLGYFFSPLKLFYCFAADGTQVQSVVAEVQNTPWLERHRYVLWEGNRESNGAADAYRHAKTFHVSPFMEMNMEYRWRIAAPGADLHVGIENVAAESVVFRAGLALRRVEWTAASRSRMVRRYPFMPARITAAIYWQAFQLWRKKCPFHAHPKHTPSVPPSERAVSEARYSSAYAEAVSCDA
jgi:DUF1365 family protein